jgi:hydroxymethylbilane synthase
MIRIGTRDSKLAVWQAEQVLNYFTSIDQPAELVYIKSEGDTDLITPLYAMGVQGVFSHTLDAALLNNRIDIAVHSMKDVPVQLAQGIVQAAVLPRATYKDILVYKNTAEFLEDELYAGVIATSSIRRKAQWLHRYSNYSIENLRGNVNTRLRKVEESNWDGAIFAAAGLERIGVRPANSIDLDWMLPAPAQGAILVVCRKEDENLQAVSAGLNDPLTALCVKIERDFLTTLHGGCTAPVSALAQFCEGKIFIKGSIFSVNGKKKVLVEKSAAVNQSGALGVEAGEYVLNNGGREIVNALRDAK